MLPHKVRLELTPCTCANGESPAPAEREASRRNRRAAGSLPSTRDEVIPEDVVQL